MKRRELIVIFRNARNKKKEDPSENQKKILVEGWEDAQPNPTRPGKNVNKE